MKNLSFILFVFTALVIGSSVTGCGSDDVPPVATVDTTDNNGGSTVIIKNKVTVGLFAYNILEDSERTYANYSSSTGNTELIVYGRDENNGAIDFNIVFPGKTARVYLREDEDGTAFQIGTGVIGDLKRKEYSALTTEFTITVTEVGAVGGRIKGTFTGQAKSSAGQTINITKGEFDVVRRVDL
tara:strand:- start:7159 stop:7710 length:552 start_codon:yes stop_codon:yes gene_type:complete